VVEFAAQRPQAGFDITKTLTVSELSEGHRQILIPASQTSMVMIAIIAGDAFLEFDVGEMGDQWSEHGPTGIHAPLFCTRRGRIFWASPAVFSSNRFFVERHSTL